MKCTEKEQETCQVEKMGCEGCAYDEPLIRELTEIEYKLNKLSRQNNLILKIDTSIIENPLCGDYTNVTINAFKELK